MTKWLSVLVYGFGLNLVWENLHSLLYVQYKSNPINELILFRASLADAFIILAVIITVRLFEGLRSYWLFALLSLGTFISISIELWALQTHRWQYSPAMPIIPALGTGLTPTIQLGLLGGIVYWLVFQRKKIK